MTQTAPEGVFDVCVLGLGVVGLPMAALLAQVGLRVCGVDINTTLLEALQSHRWQSAEPDLAALVIEQHLVNRLTFVATPAVARTYILATPTHQNTTEPYQALDDAITALIPNLRPNTTIIVESTCAPGTTRQRVVEPLERAGWVVGETVFVGHCPERVLPGAALHELVWNERLVAGATKRCAQHVMALYAQFVKGALHCAESLEIVEAAKLVENAYREMNIAFANQLADWSNTQGLDVSQLINAANTHPRVHILSPGPGVGGRCLPLATQLLTQHDPDAHLTLLQQTKYTHEQLPARLAQRVLDALRERGAKTPWRIALFGVAYKANVADARLAPAQQLARHLSAHPDVELRAHDPLVATCDWIELDSRDDALHQADALVIATAHSDFESLLPEDLVPAMRGRLIFDFCTIVSAEPFVQMGFDLMMR